MKALARMALLGAVTGCLAGGLAYAGTKPQVIVWKDAGGNIVPGVSVFPGVGGQLIDSNGFVWGLDPDFGIPSVFSSGGVFPLFPIWDSSDCSGPVYVQGAPLPRYTLVFSAINATNANPTVFARPDNAPELVFAGACSSTFSLSSGFTASCNSYNSCPFGNMALVQPINSPMPARLNGPLHQELVPLP